VIAQQTSLAKWARWLLRLASHAHPKASSVPFSGFRATDSESFQLREMHRLALRQGVKGFEQKGSELSKDSDSFFLAPDKRH